MTHCHSTAYIVVDGNEVGMLACELEAGHHDDRREHPLGGLVTEAEYAAERPADLPVAWPVYPGTPHQHTLTWADVTTEDIDEAFDPDETFDLEVDIAPAEVIEHQARVTADAEPVERELIHPEMPCACGYHREAACAASSCTFKPGMTLP